MAEAGLIAPLCWITTDARRCPALAASDATWPFKRAAIDRGEGDGLFVVTGLAREEYLADSELTEAAVRGALSVSNMYRTGKDRPEVGEIHIDPLRGYTLVFADTGSRVHLGRGSDPVLEQRLDRFDSAWAALSSDEQKRARTFFIDNETRQHSVTIAFAQ